jgi:hypothetical protein
MATLNVPHNPNLTADDVFNAISTGFEALGQVKRPPRIPGAASVLLRKDGVQVAVKLHQRPDRTYLVVNSQPGSMLMMILLGIIFAYLFTAGKRKQAENEVIDYLTRWLVPAGAGSATNG